MKVFILRKGNFVNFSERGMLRFAELENLDMQVETITEKWPSERMNKTGEKITKEYYISGKDKSLKVKFRIDDYCSRHDKSLIKVIEELGLEAFEPEDQLKEPEILDIPVDIDKGDIWYITSKENKENVIVRHLSYTIYD